MPALALMKPWCVSVMRSVPRRRSTRCDSRFDEGDLVLLGAVEGHDPALGLRDDLARHDDEVVVLEGQALRRRAASRSSVDQVVALVDHGRRRERG